MKAVFLDRQTFSDNLSIDKIANQLNNLTCYALTSPAQIIERCLTAELIITNKVLLTKAVLEQLPRVKLICIAATGTNNVDIQAANSLGIAVCNVTDYAKGAIAQYVFAQILEYYNHTSHHLANVAQGLWQQHHSFCYHGAGSTELAGRTLAIVGYGALGQSVAKIAQAFDMKVIVAERQNAKIIRANRVAFDDALKQADILSLHCPQTPDTEKLINQQTLAQMKPNAMLINTARGAIVDSHALHHALKSKQLAYAVLDVLEQEPPPADHILLKEPLANLKITAHIAWASHQAQQRLLDTIADNITSFKQGKLINQVN